MNEKLYGYMNWPRIEAIVYGEETAPRDVMGPRITPDGVLIQGFFPGADGVSVISENKNIKNSDKTFYLQFSEKLFRQDILQYCFLCIRCRNINFL